MSRMRRIGMLGPLALLLIAARPYDDARRNFRVELAPGWKVAPRFGDTEGMVFEKRLSGRGRNGVGIFMVRVADDQPLEAMISAAVGSASPREGSLKESRANIDGAKAIVREFTAEIPGMGSRRTKTLRLHAYQKHQRTVLVHVESLTSDFRQVAQDASRMLATLHVRPATRASVGSSPQAPDPKVKLVKRLDGIWVTKTGNILELGDDGSFVLQSMTGRYQATENELTLLPADGARQTFSFQLSQNGNRLELRTAALTAPLVYSRRSASAIDRAQLLGVWWMTRGPRDFVRFELEDGGQFTMGKVRGKWTRPGPGKLRLAQSANEVVTYDIVLAAERLILSGADLDKPVSLRRTKQ